VQADLKRFLENLYFRYNRRRFVHPDPLEFLYRYDDILDREIAGMVASTLAFGKVEQILKSVSAILEFMGDKPRRFLEGATRKSLDRNFSGFKHRWVTGRDISSMLFGIKHVMEKYGSLHECFTSFSNDDDETILPALSSFANELKITCNGMRKGLLPSPEQGSACKRLNLFLRWMVRRDNVDPGGWDDIPKTRLIVPLDTHMHRICLSLGLTKRKQADMRTACEITGAFRKISPADPVRYDFALTRTGIRKDVPLEAFLKDCSGWGKAESRGVL
jgi:uncharacterized protein (TIGR02757 family)